MAITASEINQWKERIEDKIESTITELLEQHDPAFMQRIDKEATAMAIESLGGTLYLKQITFLQEKVETLNGLIDSYEKSLADLAKKAGVDAAPYFFDSRDNVEHWNSALKMRLRATTKTLLSREPLGQSILKLRQEKESLLDTVWLSTSFVQIQQLWKRVMALTASELSESLKQILARPANLEEAK